VYKICSIFFPGYLDFTYWQFRQATGQSGEQINNWHPPMVSYMLRTSQQTFGDIGWFFVFNVLILWMGIVLILDYLIVNKIWCIVLSVLLALSPFILPFQVHFYKDITFGASLLLSVGILCLTYRKPNWKFLYFIIPLIILYSISIRHNGIFAVIPICFAYVDLMSKRINWFQHRKWIKASAVVLLIFVGSRVTNYMMIEEKKSRIPVQMLLVFDLAGMSVESDEVLFPDFYRQKNSKKLLTVDYIKKGYNPDTVFNLLWGNIDFIFDHKHEWGLIFSWFKGVFRYPLAYLHHRLRYFYYFINPRNFDHRAISGNLLHKANDLQKSSFIDTQLGNIISIYSVRENKWFKTGWIYFLMYLFLLPWMIGRRKELDLVMKWAYVSGFSYFLSYIFVGASVSIKYVWWAVLILPFCLVYAAKDFYTYMWGYQPGRHSKNSSITN
jgi:hypothetical protein